MEPIEVILTRWELMTGAICGSMRQIEALLNNSADAHGFNEEHGWNIHIEGACAEIAAAKALQRYWECGVNVFHAPDIGHNIQVRRRSRHDWDLYVRPKDNPDHLWVLVTGIAPRFVVRGYMLGHEIRREGRQETYGGRPPAWFVSQDKLHDINDLKYQERQPV